MHSVLFVFCSCGTFKNNKMKLSIRMGLKKTPFLLIKPCYSHFRTLDFVLLVKLTPRGNIICVVGSTSTTESRGDPTDLHPTFTQRIRIRLPPTPQKKLAGPRTTEQQRSGVWQGKALQSTTHRISHGSSPAKAKASIFFSQQQKVGAQF